eukprot:CAMPEP_0172761212 /NCGR_PEP_ID=MMETSP1074-20121228/171174_1 /TAXON_ID=2916 /ORGANISM="Ceratium fusus, Strain PA161109" /LENGTH=327 /DNA_ID=CAMNT_0013595375 /DNA_START=9 /DNA_END=992 /DNA_ORIENTATION=+
MEKTAAVEAGTDDKESQTATLQAIRVRTLKGHGPGESSQTCWVRAIVALGEQHMASACASEVMIWDLQNGACLRTLAFPTDTAHDQNWISGLASLQGGAAVAASSDMAVHVWDVASGGVAYTFVGHSSWINTLCPLGPDKLISAGDDWTLRVWSTIAGDSSKLVLSGHTDSVLAVASDAAAAVVISGAKDFTLRAWAPNQGTECMATFEGHANWIQSVACISRNIFASGSDDKTVRLWELESGVCMHVLDAHSLGVQSLAVISEGTFVSGGSDGLIKAWTAADGNCLASIIAHKSCVRTLATIAGGMMASGGDDKNVHIWALCSPAA